MLWSFFKLGSKRCDNVVYLKDALEATKEIFKLVKNSPQRETHLKEICLDTGNVNPGIHAFCLTRWTVLGSTLLSILDNHNELMDLWDVVLKLS